MRYVILKSPTDSGLEEIVMQYINMGYAPIGGVYVHFYEDGDTIFYQSMLRK